MNKIAIGFVSALAGGTMLVTGASAASAATHHRPYVEIRDISPNPVVVKAGSETTAYFKVGASRNAEKVTLSVQPEGVHTLVAKTVKPLDNWRFSVPFSDGDPAGKWKATAVATDKDGHTSTDTAYFSVEVQKGKADTRIVSFSADPYKVKKGRTIHFYGKLQASDDGWDGVRGEKVNIYYQANGSSGWKWVDSARTRWNGKFYGDTRAYRSGLFKAVYAGNDELNGSESRRDYVKVYRHWWR